MNAESLLVTIARVFGEHNLEAILVGNAAAALHGAPVTTLDIDFMFRKTPQNLKKLKAIAKDLEAVILRPYYPASELFRLTRDRDGLQIDMMARLHGVSSFAGLRSRSQKVRFGRYELFVASLEDVIKSKESADRVTDRAVLPVLRKTLKEKPSNGSKEKAKKR